MVDGPNFEYPQPEPSPQPEPTGEVREGPGPEDPTLQGPRPGEVRGDVPPPLDPTLSWHQPFGQGQGSGGWGGPPWAGGWNAPLGPGWGWNPPPPPAHRGSKALSAVVAAAVVVLLVGAGFVGYALREPASQSSSAIAPSTPSRTFTSGTLGHGRTTTGAVAPTSPGASRTSTASGSPANVTAIASGVDPELVDINTTLKYQGEEAAGTGMVLTSNGLVLTNNHVIEEATTITATDIGNGKTYTATVVGYDRTNDVAVISLQGASGLKTVSIGNSSSVATGQGVVCIGNAGGVGGSPSVAGGSVTALDQSITATDAGDGTTETLTNLIETNAHIEPGDSGGPMVTTAGKVVGMDTAASTTGGFSFRSATSSRTEQGYAIPINEAMTLAKKIEAGSGSTIIHIGKTAFLGVEITTASTSTPGAVVARVITGTPASQTSLAPGDVITSFAGTTVTSPNSLSDALLPYHPGTKVAIGWTTTTGAHQTATVTLANGPAQ